jgi:hypothetical protein
MENFNLIKAEDVQTAMSKQICGKVMYTGSVNEQILRRPGIMFFTRELLGKQKTHNQHNKDNLKETQMKFLRAKHTYCHTKVMYLVDL